MFQNLTWLKQATTTDRSFAVTLAAITQRIYAYTVTVKIYYQKKNPQAQDDTECKITVPKSRWALP